MNDLTQKAEGYLATLRGALSTSYSSRNKHIFFISLTLFLSALIVLVSILILIAQAAPKYGTVTISTGAGLVLVLIFVILALVLHGMSLGRMTSVMVGVLKSSMDVLTNEVQALTSGSVSTGHNDFAAPASPDAGSERLAIARVQVQGIVSELETAQGAIQNQAQSLDMAVFAYGFAGICLLSTGVLAFGSTDRAEFLRVLLLAIGMVCATACYAVLARPTNPQFLVEQTLRKLGLSVEALADSMRARAGKPPPFAPDNEVFEADGDVTKYRSPSRD